jgi:hypothetical protein
MSAKDLLLRPIPAADGNAIIRSLHYSGKVVPNSNLHIGVFLRGRLEGALQFGPSLDKSKMLGLVEGTEWDNFIELNRMAFSDRLPRNSESRAIGISLKLLRRHAPRVKWVLSFADATQCGDGTIYRASGFVLTGIKESTNLARLPDGSVVHKMTLESGPTRPRPEAGGRSYYEVTGGRYAFRDYVREVGGVIVSGHQLRYINFLDPNWAQRLTVPVLPYSEIARVGAGMYRGLRRESVDSDAPAFRAGEGGANPTSRLQTSPIGND